MPSDIEIAQAAKLQRISKVALEKLGIAEDHLEPYGHYKAKISLKYLDSLKGKPDGKLILVTAMTPTPAGEGKTTTTVGLGDALNHIGKKAVICLREPSLGPVFGVKGGAAGGGYAQVVPMEDINLHFTGDFSAIALANNLLAALLDNHINHGNELGLDLRRIQWKRVVDMNDRALRDIVVALGGTANGYPRQDGFDIVVASEVMAIFCLSTSVEDLKARLGNIVVGYTKDQKAITARDLKAHGAMTVLLKDALAPNLVQTLENNPAFIHGGPFANIAHGCNSVIATQSALKLADYVVTEAGFGADLGAEKFVDIKCRKTGLRPNATVIVATVRALKYHGGQDLKTIGQENLAALEKGLANLERHVENVQKNYGIPCVVSINRFNQDTAGRDRAAEEPHGEVRRAGGPRDPLGRRRQGRGRARARRRRAVRSEVGLPLRLRGRRHALGQDQQDRQDRVPRRRRHRGREGARADQEAAGRRLRPLSDLRGEDPVLLCDRPAGAGGADRARRQRARGPARGRGRVHRHDLRRRHDHARPAQGAVGREDRHRRRQGRRAVLSGCGAGAAGRSGGAGVESRPRSFPRQEEGPLVEEVFTHAFWVGLAKIIGVNIVLSGDNAVVIALAARSLPPKQQKQAIIWGVGRRDHHAVILTVFAVALLTLPWLKLIGAALLLWIGVKLLIPEHGGENVSASDNLVAAIKTILIADLVMSLDNVIAVAAAAGGSLTLLILGLAISIPLVVFGATMLIKVMERWPSSSRSAPRCSASSPARWRSPIRRSAAG